MANPALPTQPSDAYQQASKSLVYRLSEQMFGSLLASYGLGFLGFLALHATSAKGAWHAVTLTVVYLSISLTYAYATVGLYLTYHAGILTMHHMPLENLRYDFFLA